MRVTLDQQPTITLPNGQTFRAIVRRTAEERAEGMQNRSSLSPDEVMLFVHPETETAGRKPRRHVYHMRNVVMSLDMVRLMSAAASRGLRRHRPRGDDDV